MVGPCSLAVASPGRDGLATTERECVRHPGQCTLAGTRNGRQIRRQTCLGANLLIALNSVHNLPGGILAYMRPTCATIQRESLSAPGCMSVILLTPPPLHTLMYDHVWTNPLARGARIDTLCRPRRNLLPICPPPQVPRLPLSALRPPRPAGKHFAYHHGLVAVRDGVLVGWLGFPARSTAPLYTYPATERWPHPSQ